MVRSVSWTGTPREELNTCNKMARIVTNSVTIILSTRLSSDWGQIEHCNDRTIYHHSFLWARHSLFKNPFLLSSASVYILKALKEIFIAKMPRHITENVNKNRFWRENINKSIISCKWYHIRIGDIAYLLHLQGFQLRISLPAPLSSRTAPHYLSSMHLVRLVLQLNSCNGRRCRCACVITTENRWKKCGLLSSDNVKSLAIFHFDLCSRESTGLCRAALHRLCSFHSLNLVRKLQDLHHALHLRRIQNTGTET